MDHQEARFHDYAASGKQALYHLKRPISCGSIRVPSSGGGEIHGIIGASGAGKSTLLRLMNVLERPDEGNVVVNGEDLTRMPEKRLREARRSIGMIFQHYHLVHNRTVSGNVAMPLELAGVGKKRERNVCANACNSSV